MDTFKECLAEDYSKAVAKSLETILGTIERNRNGNTSLRWKQFPKIVETAENKRIVNTFRPVR